MKRPAFQFYPADWRKDAALQSCSMAAQGLWVNLMCIAHECEPYGHLVVNGRHMTSAQIARLVGLGERECAKLLAELESAGVTSKSSEGAIFSRRMVRDEEIRNKRAAGGEAGAEHGFKGAEHGHKGGRPRIGRGVIEPPKEPPPSSSSSSSSSETPKDKPLVTRASRKPPLDFAVAEDLAAWAAKNVPAVDVDAETAKFRDHTFSRAISDWPGAWRNWMRKAAELAPKAAVVRHPAANRQIALEEENERVRQQWLKEQA